MSSMTTMMEAMIARIEGMKYISRKKYGRYADSISLGMEEDVDTDTKVDAAVK